MAYSKSKTIGALAKAFENPEGLYQSDCVNWKGRTKDTHEYYSEIISRAMISSRKINRIDAMKRGGNSDFRSISGQNVFFLAGLKKPLNRCDTLLKAVLEIRNYSQRTGGKKSLQGALFLSASSLAAEEALRLREMPNLKKLIKFLKIKIFILDANEVLI